MIVLRQRPLDLRLRHTFRIARGASDARRTLLVELEDGDRLGRGEAAPIARYDESYDSAARAVAAMAERLEVPRRIDGVPAAVARAAGAAGVAEERAARAAVDMALHDLVGRHLGTPLYRLFGLDPKKTPPTSFTIALDRPAAMAERAREAADFAVLKIKLGTAEDRAIVEAIRAAVDLPLRVDANEGWTLAEARERLPWLASMGVELVEQPLPAGRLGETRELRRESPLPLFADEDARTAEDVPRLAGVYHGINVKLMKCGGIGEARRMIAAARAHGLEVMLGCMIESSLAITAAAHLSPAVDRVDLDGHLLIENDPFTGARLDQGRLLPPAEPGLGVV